MPSYSQGGKKRGVLAKAFRKKEKNRKRARPAAPPHQQEGIKGKISLHTIKTKEQTKAFASPNEERGEEKNVVPILDRGRGRPGKGRGYV